MVWTPAANISGNITPFSVEAFDGALPSAAPVPVVVSTVLPATVSLTANKAKASKNNPTTTGEGQFTVTRTHGVLNQPLTVFYSIGGSATPGTDYQPVSGSVTLNAHQTSATIDIIPNNNGIAEPTESVVLAISSDPSSYGINASKHAGTVTIADNSPTVTIAATRPKASEINNGSTIGTGLFTFTRTGGDISQQLIVDYTVGGTTMSNGTDYNQLSGSITIQPNQKTATLTIVPKPRSC